MTPVIRLAIALAVIVVLVILIGPAACNKIRSLETQGRVDRGQMGAATNSARDAIQTQGEVHGRERETQDLTRTNREDILNANGADARVDPALGTAGLHALCRRRAYRDRAECLVLQPPAP